MSQSKPPTDANLNNLGEIDVDIERVAHGGVFVARHEGRVVFVADAIPGERVRARVTDTQHDRFWRATTVEVLDASPDRRDHIWGEASLNRDPDFRAGGAEFGHITPPRQRALKADVVAEAFVRFGGIELPINVESVPVMSAVTDDGIGWRTRVTLHVGQNGEVGPYAARSRRVIPVTSIPLAVPELQAVAPLGERLEPGYEVHLIAPSAGQPIVMSVAADTPRGRRGGQGRNPQAVTTGRGKIGANPSARAVAGNVSANLIEEQVGGRIFRLDRDGFWQVHRAAAVTLSDAVRGIVDDGIFDPRADNLDLYGGVGLFAAALGDRFGATTRITSVESEARATEHAEYNLSDWVGARAVTARVEHYLEALSAGAQRAPLRGATVVLDPPRSGAGRTVIDRLTDLHAEQIVYVACDPVALGRDTGLLRERGYDLTALRSFDLFPHTHHVESVARFTKI